MGGFCFFVVSAVMTRWPGVMVFYAWIGWVGGSVGGWLGRDARRGAALGLDTVRNAMCAYSTLLPLLLSLCLVLLCSCSY